MKGKGRNERGFTLIELLVVVAIILVIVAIAIPSYLSAKKAANESSIAASLRSIDTAEELFARQCFGSYSAALSNLGGASLTACTPPVAPATSITQGNLQVLGDAAITVNGLKNNYTLVYTTNINANNVATQWALSATLAATTTPSSRSYCIDNTTNAIHYLNAGTAIPTTGGICGTSDGNL